jgi:hypothetical protein
MEIKFELDTDKAGKAAIAIVQPHTSSVVFQQIPSILSLQLRTQLQYGPSPAPKIKKA